MSGTDLGRIYITHPEINITITVLDVGTQCNVGAYVRLFGYVGFNATRSYFMIFENSCFRNNFVLTNTNEINLFN